MSCKKAANVTGAKPKTPVIPVTTPKPAPPPAATTPPSATIPAMSSAPIVNYPLYPTIMIETTDNQVVEVSMFPLAKHSPVIRKMLYAYCSNPKRIDPVLRLDPAFDTATLLKVIEWCDHYRHWDPAVPLELAEISEWDANFLRMDMKSLLEVVKASYYLEIDGLGDVTCHGLAQLMEGKSPQQLREMFNIVNDFRGDEEANARGCTGTGGCSHTRASRGTNTIPAGATGVTSTAAKSAPHAASKQSRKQMRASQRSKASCAVQAGAPCKGTACSVRSP